MSDRGPKLWCGRHNQHYYAYDGCVECRRDDAVDREEHEYRQRRLHFAEEDARARADEGVCACCGQRFVERTRMRPSIGKTWVRVLAPHSKNGVCPACYNNWGIAQDMERDWTREEGGQYWRRSVESKVTAPELEALAHKLGDEWPELAQVARARAADLEIADISRRIGEAKRSSLAYALASEIGAKWPEKAAEACKKGDALAAEEIIHLKTPAEIHAFLQECSAEPPQHVQELLTSRLLELQNDLEALRQRQAAEEAARHWELLERNVRSAPSVESLRSFVESHPETLDDAHVAALIETRIAELEAAAQLRTCTNCQRTVHVTRSNVVQDGLLCDACHEAFQC